MASGCGLPHIYTYMSTDLRAPVLQVAFHVLGSYGDKTDLKSAVEKLLEVVIEQVGKLSSPLQQDFTDSPAITNFASGYAGCRRSEFAARHAAAN